MKRRELEQHLKKHGLDSKEGSRHKLWYKDGRLGEFGVEVAVVDD